MQTTKILASALCILSFGLMTPAMTQPKDLPPGFPVKIWNDYQRAGTKAQYQQVFKELQPYQHVRNRAVNYMIGFTACKLYPDCPLNGIAFFKNAKTYGVPSPAYVSKIDGLIAACGKPGTAGRTERDIDLSLGGSDADVASLSDRFKGGAFYGLLKKRQPYLPQRLPGFSLDSIYNHRFARTPAGLSRATGFGKAIGTAPIVKNQFLLFYLPSTTTALPPTTAADPAAQPDLEDIVYEGARDRIAIEEEPLRILSASFTLKNGRGVYLYPPSRSHVSVPAKPTRHKIRQTIRCTDCSPQDQEYYQSLFDHIRRLQKIKADSTVLVEAVLKFLQFEISKQFDVVNQYSDGRRDSTHCESASSGQQSQQEQTGQQGQQSQISQTAPKKPLSPAEILALREQGARQILDQWDYMHGLFNITDTDPYYKNIYFVSGSLQISQLIAQKDKMNQPPVSPGYTNPLDISIVYDQGSGNGTLSHELTHLFLDLYFPDAPAWFNEGLSCMFEESRDKSDADGKWVDVQGADNWRKIYVMADTSLSQYPRASVDLGPLLRMDTKTFQCIDTLDQLHQAIHFAMARYLIIYLQSRAVLPAVCRDLYSMDVESRLNPDVYIDCLLKNLGMHSVGELETDFLQWFSATHNLHTNPFH